MSGLDGEQDWVSLGQHLRDLYRAEERCRVPSTTWKRCRGRDLWFQTVVPTAMVLHALVIEPLGLLDLYGRFVVRVFTVASDCAVDPMFSDMCAALASWADRVLANAKSAGQPKARRPSAPTFRFAVMAFARGATDAGWLYPATVRQGVLVPPMSALGLQGSVLCLSATFVLGQTATLVCRSFRSGAWLAVLLVARFSGLAHAATRLQQLPHLSRTVVAAAAAAKALATVASSAMGLAALLPLPHVAHRIARALDNLTQQAQRLRTSLFSLVLRHSWRCWIGYLPFGKGRSRRTVARGWRWQVPDAVMVPHELCCPITWQLFTQPVILHGDVFERSALERWLRKSARHPLRADVAAYGDDVRSAEGMETVCHAFAAQRGLSAEPLC